MFFTQGPLEIVDLLLEDIEKEGIPMEDLQKRLESIETRKSNGKTKYWIRRGSADPAGSRNRTVASS